MYLGLTINFEGLNDLFFFKTQAYRLIKAPKLEIQEEDFICKSLE